MTLGQVAAVAEGLQGPFDRHLGELAPLFLALTQAGGRLFGDHHIEAAKGRIHRCDQQVGRIGADVDGGDPTDLGVGGLGHRSTSARVTLPLPPVQPKPRRLVV